STARGPASDFIDCPQGRWCTQDPNSPYYGQLDPEEVGDKRSYLYYGYLIENVEVFATLVLCVQAPGLLQQTPQYQQRLLDSDINLGSLIPGYSLAQVVGLLQSYIDESAAELGAAPGTYRAQGNNAGTSIM